MIAVPEVRGSVPSTVYLVWATPDPPMLSLALSVTDTGVVRYQPEAGSAGDGVAVVVGAVASLKTVTAVLRKLSPSLQRLSVGVIVYCQVPTGAPVSVHCSCPPPAAVGVQATAVPAPPTDG